MGKVGKVRWPDEPATQTDMEEVFGLREPTTGVWGDPTSQIGTFADIIKSNVHLQVAFYKETLNIFTESDKLDFVDLIGDIIYQTPDGSVMPSFMATGRRDRYLIVTASDEFSRDWLLSEASNLKLDGIPLVCIPAKEIPKLKRGLLWLPGKQKFTNDELLKRLKKQNANLQVERWRVFTRHEEPHGIRLLIGIPEEFVELLNSIENKPQWSTMRGQFTPLEEVIRRKRDRKPVPESTKSQSSAVLADVNSNSNIGKEVTSKAGKRKPESDVSLGRSSPTKESGKERETVFTPKTALSRTPPPKVSIKRGSKKRKEDDKESSTKITEFFQGVDVINSTPRSVLASSGNSDPPDKQDVLNKDDDSNNPS